jgi:hypothetical protein
VAVTAVAGFHSVCSIVPCVSPSPVKTTQDRPGVGGQPALSTFVMSCRATSAPGLGRGPVARKSHSARLLSALSCVPWKRSIVYSERRCPLLVDPFGAEALLISFPEGSNFNVSSLIAHRLQRPRLS